MKASFTLDCVDVLCLLYGFTALARAYIIRLHCVSIYFLNLIWSLCFYYYHIACLPIINEWVLWARANAVRRAHIEYSPRIFTLRPHFFAKLVSGFHPATTFGSYPAAQYSAALESLNETEVKHVLILLKRTYKEFNAAYNNTSYDRHGMNILNWC